MRKLVSALAAITVLSSEPALGETPLYVDDPLPIPLEQISTETSTRALDALEEPLPNKNLDSILRFLLFQLHGEKNSHVSLAIGENIEKQVLGNLRYYPERDLVNDESNHPNETLIMLLRQLDDWNKVFDVPVAETIYTRNPKFKKMTLREIVRKSMKTLGVPYVDDGLNSPSEVSTDEWSLSFLAYASRDPEFKTMIEKGEISGNYPGAKYPQFKPHPVSPEIYMEGVRAEFEVSETEAGGGWATCNGAHAQEALLSYMVYNEYESQEIDPILDLLFDRLELYTRKDSLDINDVYDLSHRLDALSQIAQDYKFKAKERALIQKAANKLCQFYSETRLDRNEIPTMAHSYIGLYGLKQAGTIH